ncbi:unnamed protein product [Peronospora destructor]|nr:unnamed protein product [Peronospora destructor]
MIAVVPDCICIKELKELEVLVIQPAIALAHIATRMALLNQKLAESLSHEMSTTSDFVTTAYLSDMRREGRRLALGRSVVKHHSANYDRLAEILAAESLPVPPPPLRVSMFGTSSAGFDPFSRRDNGMSAYEHFVIQDVPTVHDPTVFNEHFVQRSAGPISPRLGISPSPQGGNPYAFVRSRSSERRSRGNSGRGSVQRRTRSNV